MKGTTSSTRNFTDFANTLSFYNSSSSLHPQPSNPSHAAATAPANSSGGGLYGSSNLTVSLESKPSGYGTSQASAVGSAEASAESVGGGRGGERVGMGGLWNGVFGGSSGGDAGGAGGRGLGRVPEESNEEENQGLIMSYAQKGLSLAKQGMGNVTTGARTVVTTASNKLQDGGNGGGGSTWAMMNPQRMMMFGIAAAVGCLFMALSFLMFPLILVAPAKFALMFTLGSLSFLVSFVLLKGLRPFLAHIISWERYLLGVCTLTCLGISLPLCVCLQASFHSHVCGIFAADPVRYHD
eukprot:GHVQ01025156.1.p1 GENE.GHVQ01025156.1~~GHVQ01025156.1.p1  ORF type:complete len:296 (+),score=56.42 GHVQ01025156.1:109-996(+)